MTRKVNVITQFKEEGLDRVIGAAKGALNTLQAIEEVKEWIQLAQNWTKEWAENLRDLGIAGREVKSYFGWVEELTRTSAPMSETVFGEINKGLQIVNKEFGAFVGKMDENTLKKLIQDIMHTAASGVELLTTLGLNAMEVVKTVGLSIYQTLQTLSTFIMRVALAAKNVGLEFWTLITKGFDAAEEFRNKNGTALDILMGKSPDAESEATYFKNYFTEMEDNFIKWANNKITVLKEFEKTAQKIAGQIADPNFVNKPNAPFMPSMEDLKQASENDDYWANKLVEWQIKWSKLIKQHEKEIAQAALDYRKGIDSYHTSRMSDNIERISRIEKAFEEEREKKLKKRRDEELEFYRTQMSEIANVGVALQNDVLNRLEDAVMSGKSLNETFKDFDLGKFLMIQMVSLGFNLISNSVGRILNPLLGLTGGFTGGPVKRMATGGPVNGQDSVLALLDPREYVIPGNIVEAIKSDKKIQPGRMGRSNKAPTINIYSQPTDSATYWYDVTRKHIIPALQRNGG